MCEGRKIPALNDESQAAVLKYLLAARFADLAVRSRRDRWHCERGNFQPSICVPRVAAAVLSLQLLKSVQPENIFCHTSLLQSVDQPITLRVQIRADVMRDLSGRVTQTDSLIEGDGTKPNFLSVIKAIPVPEPDVMPLPRAVANWLLEGEVLLTSKQFQSAHRRGGVRSAQDGIHRNAYAAAKCERVGGIPLRSDHRMNHIGFRTEEGNVDGIAGNACGSVRDAWSVKELGMTTDVPFPAKGHDYVRDQQIYQNDQPQ